MRKKRNIFIFPIILMGMLFMLTNSCMKDDDNNSTAQIPVLTTIAVSNITHTTASCGGNITSYGGATVTSCGVCWGISPTPTIADSKKTYDNDTRPFISNITGLAAGTVYYVRAYATNRAGTGYGSEISFTTPGGSTGTVTDYDGNVYNTITIGTQVWLVENLKVTHYRNGDPIPNVTGDADWSNLTTGAYCNYNNSVNYGMTYGRLYNWFTVNDSRNIAPTGWHVPSDEEWTTLTNYLGGEMVAGGKLKEMGITHWISPNTGATNETVFTALPGGVRYVDGSFLNIGISSKWWSAAELDARSAWYRYLEFNNSSVVRNEARKGVGFSVRCVRD